MAAGPTIVTRAYSDPADLRRIEAFLTECTLASAAAPVYWHRGDLLWSMHYSPALDPRRNAQLWETAGGRLLGFAWFDPPSEVTLQVHPEVRGTGHLEEPMLAWAAARAREAPQESTPTLALFVDEDDEHYRSLVARHGFVPGEWSVMQAVDNRLLETHVVEQRQR